MMLDWIPEAEHFKLTGYSHMADDEISRIITKRRYVGWVPRITHRMTDGTIIVELTVADDNRESLNAKPLLSGLFIQKPRLCQADTNECFEDNCEKVMAKASTSVKPPTKLNSEDILAIHNVKDKILGKTCESDLLLFLENTGRYVSNTYSAWTILLRYVIATFTMPSATMTTGMHM